MPAPPFSNADIAAKFATYSEGARQMLLTIRAWVFELANDKVKVGKIDESLKWGEPA